MNNRHDKILFWGCFIALITTSYAFISRMILCGGQFKADFGLDDVVAGQLQGAGIWPFGVSIIVFSLFIDRIGYKVAMVFSFVSYLIYTAMAFMAYQAIHGATGGALADAQQHGHQLLYWGSIILGLGNGSVEAYANPIVTTMFSKDKAKWLNRLHAGWPGGLVLGGLCTIALAGNTDWRLTLGLILIPAFIFFFILISLKFPKSEREQAGVSYLAMLKELGAFGALVGFGLVFAQLGQVFGWSSGLVWGLTGAVVVTFAAITKSFGRFILAFLIVIMMPQATTELGTNGWITALMEDPMKAAGYNSAWGAGLHLGHHAGFALCRRAAHPQIFACRPIGGLFGARRPGHSRPFANRPRGHGNYFRGGDIVRRRHHLLLADDSWPDLGTMPARRRTYVERDGRHRDAGRRHSRCAIPRLYAGKYDHAAVTRREPRALRTGEDGAEAKIPPRYI